MSFTASAAGRQVISLCVCTFKRPQGIQRALKSLVEMERLADWQVEIVVVDNDPLGSASASIREIFPSGIPSEIRYFVEKTSGVSHARNRCLQEARGDLIGFIDDDEWVSRGWLVNQMAALHQHAADAVFGPVVPQFEITPPAWAADCTMYQRIRFPTGTSLDWPNAQTNNTLFRRRLIDQLGLRFSVRFASTGGEDSYFFAQALRSGCKLVWCDEADVTEIVPASRLTRTWALERAFHSGRTYVRLRSRLGMPFAYLYFAAYGLLYVLLLLLPWAALSISRSERQMTYAVKIVGNLGKVFSAFINTGKYGQS